MDTLKSSKNFDHQKSLKQTLLHKIASLTAKITLKYDIHHYAFIELYKGYLVKHIKNEHSNCSIVELSCRTGIDRRYIKQYLKEEPDSIRQPKPRLVLNEIKQICIKRNTTHIKKHGPFQSFDSICNTVVPGALTPSSIAKELIRHGNIIDNGDEYTLITGRFLPRKKDHEQQFRILTTELNNLTNTIIYNFDQNDIQDKQFQRNIFSTQINPSDFTNIKDECSQVLSDAKDKVENIILQYEENVPAETYPAFGASFFLFGYENHQTQNKTKD